MANSTGNMARNALRVSKRLVLSYVIDWAFILAIAALGAVFNQIHASNKRPFVLQDPSLAFPLKPDTVTITVAGIVALVVPAVVIFLLCVIVVPGAAAPRGTPLSLVWKRKLWEWNASWMGLALSCAIAFMVTEGLKDLAGKPRPHTLAVCNPDLNRLQELIVGGIGDSLNRPVPIMVDSRICQETDPQTLRDTFASWPSGHSSFSFAGLFYFTLFLSAKFAVTIPYLNPISYRKQQQGPPSFPALHRSKTVTNSGIQDGPSPVDTSMLAPRNQAAAPPIFLLVIVFIPTAVALFIAVSRWFDYHHFAFDIITGALIGILTAWFSFRLYHMPIRRGAGWSWGARSRDRAFWIGVGRETYVGSEGWEARRYDAQRDMEMTDLEKGTRSEGVHNVDSSPGYASAATNASGPNASIETERMPLNQEEYPHSQTHDAMDQRHFRSAEPQVGQAV